MQNTKDVVYKYNHLVDQLGKKTVSAAYPNDIEIYLCAFELVDSNRDTEAYFVFPIQPSMIQKTEPTRTTIKKSMSGTTVLKNSSFIPQEISIKGNFGRKFKILNGLDGYGYGNAVDDKLGAFKSVEFDTPTFSTSIKSGYGCIKLLQKIFQSSQKVDKYGKSKRLIFYNMGFGESYLVTIPPSGYSFSQTEDQNMIWSYQANMTVVAPLFFMNEQAFKNASKNLISSGSFVERLLANIKKIENIIKKYQKKIEDLENKIKAGIKLFFEAFIAIKNVISDIINFFGDQANLVRNAFNRLDSLIKQAKRLDSILDGKLNMLDEVAYWDIYEAFEDIKESLDSCYNLKRLLRSSSDRNASTIELPYVQKQNQTIEAINKKAGFSDQDSYVDLLISNQTTEEDYTNNGGKLLNVKIPNNSTFNLENIVDTLTPQNIYGKDIVCKLEIQSDGGLKTVSGIDSLKQTFGTIMSTIKGSIPEFPEDGVPDYVFGSNRNIIQYPIIFRSLLSMIQKDKRFTGLELLDINKDQDSIFLQLQASTIVGNNLTNKLAI